MSHIINTLKTRIAVCREIAAITNKPVLYHFLDCTYCNWKYGCRSYQYHDMDFYKLRSFDRAKVMTSGRSKEVAKYNDPQYIHIAQNKNEFNTVFKDFIKRDWLYCKDAKFEEIMAFVQKHNRVIVKPNASEAGSGIYFLESNDVTPKQIEEIIGGDILLEECVIQHPDMAFGGHSVNTIRVITMIDNQSLPHILTAALRCGVGDAKVDNFSIGGVGYPINIENGLIEAYGLQADFMHAPIYIHPNTDIVMIGKKMPFWTEILNLVTEAAKVIPQLRYVGWDVAITTQGPLLIEGNPSPGFGLIEGIGNTRGIYGEIIRYANS